MVAVKAATKAPAVVGQAALAPITRKPGRPVTTKADKASVDAICDRVSTGLSIESALVLQGIPKGSHDAFLKRYPNVAQAISEAESKFERQILGYLTAKAPNDSKVSQWLLERRLQGRYAPTNRTELTGAGGGPLQQMTVSKTLFASVAAGVDRKRPIKSVRAMAAESKSVASPG